MFRDLIVRQHNAADRFLAFVEEHTGCTRAEALRVLAYYRKNRLVKLGVHDGQFRVSHGVLLEPDVLRRAINA